MDSRFGLSGVPRKKQTASAARAGIRPASVRHQQRRAAFDAD
jgi:hypothetical protein